MFPPGYPKYVPASMVVVGAGVLAYGGVKLIEASSAQANPLLRAAGTAAGVASAAYGGYYAVSVGLILGLSLVVD